MANVLEGMAEGARWRLMVAAAKRAAEEAGYKLERIPGRGLSNLCTMIKDGRRQVASIRTTRSRWMAFAPDEEGKKWKTLDDVDLVLVATVDRKDDPRTVAVYLLDAEKVRKAYSVAYTQRVKAGQSIKNNFGMWINLDLDQRGLVYDYGSGLIENERPLAEYELSDLAGAMQDVDFHDAEPELETIETMPSVADNEPPLTIPEAKRRLAKTFGVDPSAIKISVEA